MPSHAIIYCNHIHANVGVPGVNQSLIADVGKYSEEEVSLIGCDYQSFYSFEWNEVGDDIGKAEVPFDQVVDPQVVVFSGFDPLVKILPALFRWKRKGSRIAFWTWGYHTKQQCRENWEGGKVPGWAKRLATLGKKWALASLIDHYIVFGQGEIEDSDLEPNKCVKMPMACPQSKIVAACDQESSDEIELSFGAEACGFIGRGRWEQKGIGNIVRYSKSDLGKKWKYRFFISSKDDDFDEKMEASSANNLEWFFDVFGTANISWLRRSAATLFLSRNPTQLRSAYESLRCGTPVVVVRETYMEEYQRLFERCGIGGAVQIVNDVELAESKFEIGELSVEDRKKLARVTREVFSHEQFGRWFGRWILEPTSTTSFYDYLAELITEDHIREEREC